MSQWQAQTRVLAVRWRSPRCTESSVREMSHPPHTHPHPVSCNFQFYQIAASSAHHKLAWPTAHNPTKCLLETTKQGSQAPGSPGTSHCTRQVLCQPQASAWKCACKISSMHSTVFSPSNAIHTACALHTTAHHWNTVSESSWGPATSGK